jgi:hypothetical protein
MHFESDVSLAADGSRRMHGSEDLEGAESPLDATHDHPFVSLPAVPAG